MDLNQSDWKLQCETNENSIIIDVRTEHEVAEGIIPNAINIVIYQDINNISGILLIYTCPIYNHIDFPLRCSCPPLSSRGYPCPHTSVPDDQD